MQEGFNGETPVEENNSSRYTPEQENLIDGSREKNEGIYQGRANAINAERGLWDQIRGKNKLSGVDVLHEEALAVEAERVERQAQMDSEEIDKIRKELSEKFIGYDQNTGDNTVVATTIMGERIAERNQKLKEEANKKLQEEASKKKGGIDHTDRWVAASVANGDF